jgi:lipid II:glycine glycyltransferase (peptidoglycan interpeptide bridge formation enzyme)
MREPQVSPKIREGQNDKEMAAVITTAAPVVLSRLPATYDQLVSRSPQGSIFAHRWWLEAVAPGMYEILEIKKNGGFQAAWPVVHQDGDEAKHFCMPALTQKLGILFAPSDAKPAEVQSTNQKLATELINQLGDTASFHQNFHENFTDWLPFYWRGFAQTTRYTYVFEDISDTAVLWNNLRQRTRTEIRKAQKLGIRIKDDLDLAQFVEVIRKTFERQDRSPLASDEFVYRLDAACAKNAGRKIFAGVDPQGRVHAALYVVWLDNVAYTVMGGGDPEFRRSNAYRLACWEALVFASSIARRFDLMGSMLPQVEPVFRGFGASQLPYSSITKMPPTPTSLRAFLRMAIKFRWNRARRTIAGPLKER